MSQFSRHRNLDRLCAELSVLHSGSTRRDSAKLADSLFLAHSTSNANFIGICRDGSLLSAQALVARTGVPLAKTRTEVQLGTNEAGFLYASGFRYPGTTCGLLFARTLETDHAADGIATPFDSGGLLKHFTRPDSAEPVRLFLQRHELPTPDHRRYLAQSMTVLFTHPIDYLEGVEPALPSPIGLTGGQALRRWTHEVRIPHRVHVRASRHLQAVFAARSLVTSDPHIERLVKQCRKCGVDVILFDVPRGEQFEGLKLRCLEYMREKLY